MLPQQCTQSGAGTKILKEKSPELMNIINK